MYKIIFVFNGKIKHLNDFCYYLRKLLKSLIILLFKKKNYSIYKIRFANMYCTIDLLVFFEFLLLNVVL